jgi:hypothetical protein
MGPENNYLRDYDHASRTFRANAYALHPRLSALYLCVFNFAPDVANRFTNEDKIELPLMVKSVDLPAYTIDVQDHNQYNKRVYSQHKIEYGDTRITFHDDAKELVLKMWYNYVTHYYLDSTYTTNDFQVRDRYTARNATAFGYANGNTKFFSSIQVYTLFDGKFSEYTLVNPIISAFQHPTHTAGNFETMEHSMTIKYETVLYGSGIVDDSNPKTFLNNLHYDKTPSPLGNIRPEIDTLGPFGSLFDEDSIFRQLGNTLDKLDRIVPGGTDQLIGKLNQTLGTTSLFNEVTPMVTSAIKIKAGDDPVAVLQGLPSVENDNPSVNIPQNITSNSTVIGNNNYVAQQTTSLNIGNTIVQPTNFNSASQPRKMSDIYNSRNDPQPIVNNANLAIKKLQLEGKITSVQNSLNKAASGVSPLTAEQTTAKRKELLDTTQQYTNLNSPSALSSWQNKSGVTVDPYVGVGPKTQSQELASTTTEDF